MESIYETKYGAYVDLSHIVAIEPIKKRVIIPNNKESNPVEVIQCSQIHTKFGYNPITLKIYSLKCVTPDEFVRKSKEAFEDLLSAWCEYKKNVSNE